MTNKFNHAYAYVSMPTSGYYPVAGIALTRPTDDPPTIPPPSKPAAKADVAAVRRANLEKARTVLQGLRSSGHTIMRGPPKPGGLAAARSEAYAAEMAARAARVEARNDAAFLAEARALAEQSSRKATLLEGRAAELRARAEALRVR